MASSSISPTAHYTGHVWQRHGLSHPGLDTLEGRLFYGALTPVMTVSRLLGGPTLEQFLLARHRAIDAALADAIERGEVSQVVEIAAGLSPRGLTFAQRFGDAITYVEGDLPGMVARKRAALGGSGPGNHRVVELDALAEDGPASLAAVAADLDRANGLAIVTEGLLNYFPREAVTGMWRRFAATLTGFPHGLYLSDLHLRQDTSDVSARVFAAALGIFVRGRTYMHFETAEEARAELLAAGFTQAELRHAAEEPPGARLTHVLEATVGATGSP